MKILLSLLVLFCLVFSSVFCSLSEHDTVVSMQRWAYQLREAADAQQTIEKQQQQPVKHHYTKQLPPYGQSEYSISRPEGERTFYVYQPSSYSGNVPTPLIFGVHGLNSNPLDFSKLQNMTALAEQYGFVYVYPQGFQGMLGNAWNAGTCCLRWSGIDDMTFFADMLSMLQGLYNYNPAQVYSTGFSNGGFMSERLACEAGVFRGIMSVSGDVVVEPGNGGGLDSCDQSYASTRGNTSILHVHGNADMVVPYTGDSILGFPDIPTNFQRWAERNNCTGQPTNTWSIDTYSNMVYQECSNSVQVELVINNGGQHYYPHYPAPFLASNYAIEFFQRTTSEGWTHLKQEQAFKHHHKHN